MAGVDAVVALSGGTDSAVALAMATRTRHRVMGLTVMYGQRNGIAEAAAAFKLCKYYACDHRMVLLDSDLFGRGAYMYDDPNLKELLQSYQDLNGKKSPAEIPFRNGHIISCATSIAMTNAKPENQFTEVWMGTIGRMGTGSYGDSSAEFIGSMIAAVYAGTKGKVRLVAPFLHSHKDHVLKAGNAIDVPWDITYSCYAGTLKPCGLCLACRDRQTAFAEIASGR